MDFGERKSRKSGQTRCYSLLLILKMAELPDNLSTTSLHLSRVLEEIGLNELTVEKRRDHFLFRSRLFSQYSETFLNVSFKCSSRLNATEKWAGRKRNYSWPTANLIKHIVNEPYFIVPVGYKLSSTKSMEWRISMSLAERCLMFSLNIAQIKCYVIMKMLIKTFVTPKVGKSITSYHCKMALFYCMESTETDFWREDNLLQTVARCLEMILIWVTNEFCPHFIIAEANLFAGKVTSGNKGTITSVLEGLIQRKVDPLFEIRIDGLGDRLKMQLGTKPNRSPILNSIKTVNLLGYLGLQRHLTIECTFYMCVSTYNPSVATSIIRRAITMLESRTNFSDKIQQEATGHFIMILHRLLGSLIASSCIGRRDTIPQEAIVLLDASSTSDVSSLLKQASVFYCSGALIKMEQLCRKIDNHFKGNIVFPVCQCYPHAVPFSSEQLQTLYTRRHKVRYANCVVFTRHEIHCIPQALRHELFRGVGDDTQNGQKEDRWLELAIIDCLPFLYFLQYMTNKELGNEKLRKQSLQNLEGCIREENQPLRHVETVLNILGQCYEIENQPVAALHCYSKSLDIRPRNNAANWISFYRCTQREYRLCDGLIDEAILSSPLFSPSLHAGAGFIRGLIGFICQPVINNQVV